MEDALEVARGELWREPHRAPPILAQINDSISISDEVPH